MDAEIGFAAGDVFRFIEANGPSTITRIRQGTGHSTALVNQAIGWLARENKIARSVKGKTVRWSLNQS